jgi:hypothetical protein
MGMAFPIGVKLAGGRLASEMPWLWGINGAASVCASVLAVVLAMGWGITLTFYIGMLCYVVAFSVLLWQRKLLALAE